MPIKKQRNMVCLLCAENLDQIPMQSNEVLRQFVSGQNKILPRKKTGSCAKHQRVIAREIKRARELGLLGYRGH